MKTTLLVFLIFVAVLADQKSTPLKKCTAINCKLKNNCRCSSTDNPITDQRNPAPQLVAITFNEAVTQARYDSYWKPLFFEAHNHDRSPVGLTFYVPHEDTQYFLVHDLYLRGYEIGSHSITKNSNLTYWKTATQKDLEEEFGGQKIIISTFANVPPIDIKGVRTPFLNGDVSIRAFQFSGFTYDSSWPTSLKLLPYSLNYWSTQFCEENCVAQSHPNFWEVPIISLRGKDNKECNDVLSCHVEGTADQISNWLYNQTRNYNRAPMILSLDTKWFQTVENSVEGVRLFLEKIKQENDIFLVTVEDVLRWIQNPVPAKNYKVPDHRVEGSDCLGVLCPLRSGQGQKYMRSCVICPEVYPWKGNPTGKA